MDYIYRSTKMDGKEKNGDSCLVYQDEDLFVGSVADGVGGGPCDWKASQQVCEDLLYYYSDEFKSLGIEEGFKFSLRKTYARLYWTRGECEGMLSTLASIVIDKRKEIFYLINIGDSKILSIKDGEIIETSKPTEFRIQPNHLFNYLKRGGQLKSDLHFALMTDGFWSNRNNYQQELRKLVESKNISRDFSNLFLLNQQTQKDDMTLMIISI